MADQSRFVSDAEDVKITLPDGRVVGNTSKPVSEEEVKRKLKDLDEKSAQQDR